MIKARLFRISKKEPFRALSLVAWGVMLFITLMSLIRILVTIMIVTMDGIVKLSIINGTRLGILNIVVLSMLLYAKN